MKYHLLTLGCQMNLSDGERVRTIIEKLGYAFTENEEEANLIGILACSVRQKAIDKVYAKIQRWNSWKNNKSLITFISGCILPADEEKFLKLFDIVFPMRDLAKLPEMIRQYGLVSPASLSSEHSSEDSIKSYWNVSPQYSSNFEAFVPIQNGCDKFCSFCAVPYTRGREVSRPSAAILEEVKSLVEKGYKSITLLGQNVNSYGLDKKGTEISFPELLRKIGELGNRIRKKFWVYFTSPHPRDMTEEVINVIAQFDCLAKQIHLPLQSGDNKVLFRMNRKHNVERYRDIVENIRAILPTATLFTDIIVGFTGETDEQFRNTLNIMHEFKYNMAYIAKYSPRPGATSSRWKDDIPLEIKKQRFHMLTDELKKSSFEYNKNMIGKTYMVLVTGKDKKEGYLSGKTEGKIIARFASKDISQLGTFVFVTITHASDFSVSGDLTEKTKDQNSLLIHEHSTIH